MATNRKPFRVLFVCMGNICRSPTAEIIFRHLVADAGLEDFYEIDSAGTIGYHRGNPPDPRMAATLEARGYRVSGRARPVTRGDLDAFDLVLAADQDNLADLRGLAGSDAQLARIGLITDYTVAIGADHVPDPYYGGQSGFEKVADLVEDACAGLLEATRPRE